MGTSGLAAVLQSKIRSEYAERRRYTERPQRPLLMTTAQARRVESLKKYGWTVAFQRHHPLSPAEIFIMSPNGATYLRVDADGVARPFCGLRQSDASIH